MKSQFDEIWLIRYSTETHRDIITGTNARSFIFEEKKIASVFSVLEMCKLVPFILMDYKNLYMIFCLKTTYLNT